MVRFIQLMIEEAETENPQPSALKLSQVLASQPKSRAAPKKAPQPSQPPEAETADAMSEAQWSFANETMEEINAIQTRMLNLENAMQRMLQMMQAVMPANASMPMDPCQSAVAEWEDPWNN